MINNQQSQETYKQKLDYVKAIAELDAKQKNANLTEEFRKAYIISVLFPPLGIYYCIKYVFFSGGDIEIIYAGIRSLIFTIVSLCITFWIIGKIFMQTFTNVSQKETGILKDLMQTKNQKDLIELFK